MIKLSKNHFLKLACPLLLVSYSSFVYSDIILQNYMSTFDVYDNRQGEYYGNLPTMTVDKTQRVNFIEGQGLSISMQNSSSVMNQINTGHIVSKIGSSTTKDLLGATNAHKGTITADIFFTCKHNGTNVSMSNCKRVWPAFWLWAKDAEIDIAEFQVQSDGNMSHSNHIYTYSSAGQQLILATDYLTPNPEQAVKYSLNWDCTSNYTSCTLNFLENGINKKVFYLDGTNTNHMKLINGFKNGYQIIFTQHFNSNGVSFTDNYNNFSGYSTEMIIKSLSITDQ